MVDQHSPSSLLIIGVAVVGFVAGVFSRTDLARTNSKAPTVRQDRQDHTGLGNLTTNEAFKKAGVTERDIRLTLSLQEHRRAGEFVLSGESPIMRKLQYVDFAIIAAEAASNNTATYTKLFRDLGIESDAGCRLQRHIAKIHAASLEAEVAMGQVLDARAEYDRRVRVLLGGKEYDRYRKHEAEQPVRYEVKSLREFCITNGFTFDPAWEQPLFQVIQEAGAVETGWWHGPYDSLPLLTRDPQVNLSKAQRQVSHTRKAASKVLNRLGSPPFSNEFLMAVVKYYAAKTNRDHRILIAMEAQVRSSDGNLVNGPH